MNWLTGATFKERLTVQICPTDRPTVAENATVGVPAPTRRYGEAMSGTKRLAKEMKRGQRR